MFTVVFIQDRIPDSRRLFLSETPTISVTPTYTRTVTPTLTAWNASAINHQTTPINPNVVISVSAVCSVIGIGVIVAGIIYYINVRAVKQSTQQKRPSRPRPNPPNPGPDPNVTYTDAYGTSQRQQRYLDVDVEKGRLSSPSQSLQSSSQPFPSNAGGPELHTRSMSPKMRRPTAQTSQQATEPWQLKAASVFGQLDGMPRPVGDVQVPSEPFGTNPWRKGRRERKGMSKNVLPSGGRRLKDENPVATVMSPEDIVLDAVLQSSAFPQSGSICVVLYTLYTVFKVLYYYLVCEQGVNGEWIYWNS